MRDGATPETLRLQKGGARPRRAGARSPGGRGPGTGAEYPGRRSRLSDSAETNQVPTDTELLGRLAVFGELEEGLAQGWIAGAPGPLSALVPDGLGDEHRGYGSAPVSAGLCSAVELRRAASPDELRDRDGKPCVTGSLHASYFAEPALRQNGELGTALTAGKGEAPTPNASLELQTPIRSVAAARRTGE